MRTAAAGLVLRLCRHCPQARRAPGAPARAARPSLGRSFRTSPPGTAFAEASERGGGGASPSTSTSPGPDDELDFAVFRFSLGIPGFDDADLPFVIAAVGAWWPPQVLSSSIP